MIQILALIGLFGCGLVLWSTVDLWFVDDQRPEIRWPPKGGESNG